MVSTQRGNGLLIYNTVGIDQKTMKPTEARAINGGMLKVLRRRRKICEL